MGDAGRERAAPQTRACDEPEPDAPGGKVALDHRDLREVPSRTGDRLTAFDGRLALQRLRDDLILDETDRPQRAAGPRDREVVRRERCDPDGLAHPVGDPRARDVLDGQTPLQHRRRLEALEVGENEQVAHVPGRNGAVAGEPVPERGVMGCHEHSILGRDACGNGLPNHAVHVSFVRDVLGIAVVRAERDPGRPVLLDERQECMQVARHRRLADEQPHAGA